VFTGALHDEELAAAFASSDTFVFPSLTDTFGNVVLEALSSGITAIVTHKGGPQETVQHNVTGYVVDTTQPFAMRDAMAKLVAEPVTTQQMSSHARDAALQCDWATVYNDLWDTLDIHPPSPADGGHFTERSNAAVRHTASLLQSK